MYMYTHAQWNAGDHFNVFGLHSAAASTWATWTLDSNMMRSSLWAWGGISFTSDSGFKRTWDLFKTIGAQHRTLGHSCTVWILLFAPSSLWFSFPPEADVGHTCFNKAMQTALQYAAKAKAGRGQSMQAVLQWLDGELRQTRDESRTKLGMDSQDQVVLKTPPLRVEMFKTQRLTDYQAAQV